MPKYVVLQMADDDEPEVTVGQEVVGVFKKPSIFCDNSDGHRGGKTDSGWSRGKKYGWWVCGRCKKPTQAWASNLNAVLGAARNLM